MNSTASLYHSKSAPLIFAFILSLSAIGFGMSVATNPIEGLHLAARYTARAGLPVFLLTYAASSLVILWPNAITQSLMRHRYQWAMGFVLTHTIHLVTFLVFLHVSGMTEPDFIVRGGIVGYILLYGMALTSSDSAKRVMGKWWKRLHRLGIHLLWFMFTMTYFSRLSDPEWGMWSLPLFLPCFAALCLRIAARVISSEMESKETL